MSIWSPSGAAPAGPHTAAQYLAERTRFGIKFGLETIGALVEALGHPERAYPALLVAGTNGKGSVVAYTDAVLRACGLRVGRYTSPHLVRVNERITVDGRDIPDGELEEAVQEVRAAAQGLVDGGVLADHPTYFEALTAAAFLHFRQREVGAAVLEVGMGGRLDATNVCSPLASAIVTVDFDHEAYLGTSLDAIAREKAGVLRPGRTTVLGPLPTEAREAIGRLAAERGARLVDAVREAQLREEASGLEVRTPRALYHGLKPLPGAHQRDNLLVALGLLEAAREQGLAVRLEEAEAAAAIGRTRWPGRLEEVPGRPALLLDCAHNPAGARALAAYLVSRPPCVLLFGAMADKDVAELARILFPLARSVVLTRAREDRATPPEEIARRAGAVAAGARQEPDPARALELACELASPSGTVVVAGSLYLVGEVMRLRGQGPPA